MNVLSKLSRNSSKSSLGEDFMEIPVMDRDAVLSIEMQPEKSKEGQPTNETSPPQKQDKGTQKGKEKTPPLTPLNPEILEASQCGVGSVLLEVASRLNKIEDQLKIKSPRMDLIELCYAYNEDKREDKKDYEKKIENTVQEIQERMVANKINYNVLDHRVEPPKEYGDLPQLHKPEVLRLAMLLFPKVKYDNPHKSGPITEFLERTVMAQNKLRLNRQDYLEMLLFCTSNDCHEQVKLYIQNGESVESIFFRLLTLYDRGLTLDAARTQLHNLKGSNMDTLAGIEAKILKLSAVLGRQWKAGEMRQTFCDIANCQALIQALPDKGSGSVKKKANQIYTQLV